MKRWLSFLFILVLLTGCLREGTETGDPGAPVMAIPNEGGVLIGTFTGSLVVEVCQLIVDCDGVEEVSCQSGVVGQSNIDTEIGLGETDYESLSAIQDAEQLAEIMPQSTAAASCIDDVKALTCSSPGVSDAYNTALDNAYEGVAAIIPVSCNGVFN